MRNTYQEKFNFSIPAEISKAKNNKGEDVYWVEGIASSSRTEDSDGETLLPAGFDYSEFLSKGYFNLNHQGGKSSKAILGVPTECRIIHDGEHSEFYVKGFLYPTNESKAIVDLIQNFEKYSPNRKMQLSIEGQKISTDPLNPKRITKAKVTGIALTTSAKCGNTWMNIVKGNYVESFVDLENPDSQASKAKEIGKFLIKAGYTQLQVHRELIKGGYDQDTAIAALRGDSSALPAHAAGTLFVNINDKQQLNILCNVLEEENKRLMSKGNKSDRLLADAIAGIEICHTVPEKSYERLFWLGIVLQK